MKILVVGKLVGEKGGTSTGNVITGRTSPYIHHVYNNTEFATIGTETETDSLSPTPSYIGLSKQIKIKPPAHVRSKNYSLLNPSMGNKSRTRR